MGKALRNKEMTKKVSPLDTSIMKAWNTGFSAGAKEQRKADIEHVVQLLETLEEFEGIGEKTAWKIRKMFLDAFGG